MMGAAGMLLAHRLCAAPTDPKSVGAPASKAKAKAVIQIWLSGGPTHTDTFDPKPESGKRLHRPVEPPHRDQRQGDPNRRVRCRSWPRSPTSMRSFGA